MNEKPQLWLMVGLPRGGKTTVVKKLLERHRAAVVNPDAVRLAIHGQAYVQSAEDFVWATTRAMVRALVLSGHDLIIIDACNTSRKRRDAWKYLGMEFDIGLIEVKEDTEVCLKRAEGNEDLKKAIVRMAGNYEPPSPDEGKILDPKKLVEGILETFEADLK